MSVKQLHDATGMPKPTIVRLLETLIHEGYLYKDPRMKGYQVTEKVAALSAGFHGAPLVIQLGQPWAVDLTRRLKWPTAICTLREDSVVVSYSTITDSPISPFHSTIGVRLSLARTALGRAYLAFCDEREQQILLDLIEASAAPDTPAPPRRELEWVIAETRARGYATRDPAIEPKSATVAVPLRIGERVVATFGLTYFRRAVPVRQLAELVVEPVKSAAGRIEQALQNFAGDI